jgi:glycine cleavage system transcriptional repressor
MMAYALVSILGRDRVGLVSAVAEFLFGAGVNLGDTTFATLGAGADFQAVCELPDSVTSATIEAGLKELPELAGSQIRVAPYLFEPNPGASGRVTHRIEIGGGDQLGLVARLAEVFRRYEANIVRLEARKLSAEDGGLYVTRFAVFIPAAQSQPCLATVTNTAGALGLTCEVEESPR